MEFRIEGKVIFFATNNIYKFKEARKIFADYKIALGMIRVKTTEIQSDSITEIAKTSVLKTSQKCNLPIIVEDTGLFIEGLKSFPGPYASYVYKTIGNRGILKLLKNGTTRKARFRTVIAYHSPKIRSPICFEGEITGEIVKKEKPTVLTSGFGFDPIFKPNNSNKTFGEMSIAEKNQLSHRARAIRKFAEWYKKKSAKNRNVINNFKYL